MNKILNINLGGYPFTIDEDAYEHLNRYLETIHRHFRHSEGYEEITQDIEARLAELFQEALGNRPIVTLRDVRDAIVIMGTPEEFGAEPVEESSREETGTSGSYKTGKRLFRDQEDAVVGGVCSGIAAYLGINDPLWVRLAFVLITFSGGFGIPIYLILWAIVPKAETASDRLAMRGEPINVSNIGRIIEEELERFSTKVSEFGEEFSTKKKFSGTGDENDRFNPVAEGIAFIGYLFRNAFNLIAQVWRPLLAIVIFALIIAFAVSVIVSVIGLFMGMPYVNYLFPDQSGTAMVGLINLLFLIGIPILSIILSLSRLLLGTRISSRWSTVLVALFIANVVSLGMAGSLLVRQFSAGTEASQVQNLTIADEDTLRLQLSADPYEHVLFNIDNEVRITDQEMAIRGVGLRISKANDDQFHLTQKVYSRGRNLEEATQLAGTLNYQVEQTGSTLTIPGDIVLKHGEKWRAQEVTLALEVPQGRAIFINETILRVINSIDLEDRQVSPWTHPGKTWSMEEGGLRCVDCEVEAKNMLSFQEMTGE